MPRSPPTKISGGCAGDFCDARDPWPLFHVRHRSNYCRFCTSCVLKSYPGFFCTLCFSLLAESPPPAAEEAPVIHCSRCPMVAHLACLRNPSLADQFVCPGCENPDFTYFPKVVGGEKVVDLEAAKILLLAGKLALSSMSKAAMVAKCEIERKVKEAVAAKKRVREMLERGSLVNSKKWVRRGEVREVEKWMRFGEFSPRSVAGKMNTEVKAEKSAVTIGLELGNEKSENEGEK